jgi:hypothetical protein
LVKIFLCLNPKGMYVEPQPDKLWLIILLGKVERCQMSICKGLLCLGLLIAVFLLDPLTQLSVEAAPNALPQQEITIAVVDSGVDLQHPALSDKLVAGTNLLQRGTSPIDDNGHGTNVAGVITAIAGKYAGVGGVVWKPRIMPIKALESDGTGDEAHLGEGIQYAVSHGVKIVLLSLGLNNYSTYLSQIVKEAEDNGVLLVAASGNEGDVVKYPAAYPTVLAVGGVKPNNVIEERSNYGSELDLTAPWNVYTTIKGGGYDYRDGTSMAAPQVAAACALIWEKYPRMTPAQIRNLLRQTAQDIGPSGWDAHTGYGLLRVDRALLDKPIDDIYENNDRPEDAKELPIGKQSEAALTSSDTDWFAIDAPYDGTAEIRVTSNTSPAAPIQLTQYNKLTQPGTKFQGSLTDVISFPVAKGRSYIKLAAANPESGQLINYHITLQFVIAPDPFEDNDLKYKAFVLPARSQTISGTFHQISDQDWFMIPVLQEGTLRLKLSTDTARMDLVLRVEKTGEKDVVVDQNADGQTETTLPLDVSQGNYYILVSNVKGYSYPVVGEYTLQIDYATRYVDPNEPNDRSYQATVIQPSVEYEGVLDDNTDVDWFSFKVTEESLVNIQLTHIPLHRTILLLLQNYTLKPLKSEQNIIDTQAIFTDVVLAPGTYYIKLTVDQSFQNQLYNLKVNVSPLVAGFADIAGHWAEASIGKLAGMEIVFGYGNYLYAPNQAITRAEAVTMLNHVFSWSGQAALSFNDVFSSDWFYAPIARAVKAGAAVGYPDNNFAPNKPLSRMEMVALTAHARGLQSTASGIPTFSDITADYWGAGLLKTIEARGWITGYGDGSFRPERQATRAEFAQFIVKIMAY